MSSSLRLRVPATYEPPALHGLADVVVELDPVTRSTSVIDTPDLVLTRWGAGLVEEGGWRLRLPRHASIPSSPLTLELPGPAGQPPDEALRLVRGLLRGRSVGQIVRVVTRQQRQALGLDAAEPQVTVSDEEVSVYHAQRLAGRFREVVVSPGHRAPRSLVDAVVERLQGAGATDEETVPRLVRILGPAATSPPEVTPRTLPGQPTVADLARTAVTEGVHRLLLADPHARLGRDPEGVHQARVATRRLRSDLRSFRRYLDESWLTSFRDDLKWLADALGGARDGDVLAERLEAAVEALPRPDRGAARWLLERQGDDRAAAHTALHEVLDSERYVALLTAAHRAVTDLPVLAEADVPAADAAVDIVRRPVKHLREEVAALSDPPLDEELHSIRIRAKRARYAAEAVAPALGKPARRLARAAADVQEVLGDHQDAIVTASWLRGVGQQLPNAGAAFAAGLLAGHELAAAERHRGDWPATWAAFDRGKVRGWL